MITQIAQTMLTWPQFQAVFLGVAALVLVASGMAIASWVRGSARRDTEITAQWRQFPDLLREVGDIKANYSDANGRLRLIEYKLEQSEQTIGQLQRDLEARNSEIKQYEQRLKTISAELDAAKLRLQRYENMEHRIADLEKQVEELKAQVEMLMKELEHEKTLRLEAEKAAEIAKQERDAALQQAMKAENQHKELKERVETLETEKEALETENEQLKAHLAKKGNE